VKGCRVNDAASSSRSTTDWLAWHRGYEDPGSVLSRRLEVVRATLSAALDTAADGPIQLLSACAGDGRDVLGVLERHPRARDVRATLVDLDAALVGVAREAALALGLDAVTCEVGDAGCARWYADARPIDVLLACGVFGNISSGDLARTIRAFATVVASGGHVIWTRHRREPDQTTDIRRWFEASGFEEVAFTAVSDSLASVGWHRRASTKAVAELPERLFEFVGDGSGAHA